jgi:hypothetical protein
VCGPPDAIANPEPVQDGSLSTEDNS